ncbi:hypothetical protein EJ04DRAFT_497335 [Polyplosphaeria fusca]|uniref:Uncharacterized protein n=1 Tax=Polyplosphaeria fusca TaxID=682080 RepID=A0A9P4V0I3_9PLEO|nr:hypothetical protein EJ04DRAFT_497335 [Polyplosphaeria fusca]
MPSFKKKLLSAWAWALPALSAALPAQRDDQVPQVHGKQSLLQLDLQPDYAQATFSVPCAGCLGKESDDESLILSFKTHSSDEPCGNSSNVSLNGIYLPQEWNGDLSSGSGSFSGGPDVPEIPWYQKHDLDLEWESACLHNNDSETVEDDVAQVFTVTLKGVDGRQLNKPSGFTLSFKQQSPPELLRLDVTPHRGAREQSQAEDWRAPPAHLRLTLPPSEAAGTQPTLEDELHEIQLLEANLEKLHKALEEKKKHIQSQLQQETTSFREELRQCDSVACVLQAIAHKAHGAWKVIYLRIRPDHHHHYHLDVTNMGRPDEKNPYDRIWPAGNKQAPEAITSTSETSIPGDTYAQTQTPHEHHQNQKPLFLALNIFVGILCCGCLFTVIRQRCCSIRARTERAATREERRNARAYHRAAQKLAWTKWWRSRWRDQERRADYEEKRALIQEQESILEDAMQEEIRQLQAAHGVVNSIIQAEEGRSSPPRPHPHLTCLCHHHNTSSSPPSPTPYSPISSASIYTNSSLADLPSRPLSRTNSLPDYRSDTSTQPPAYESDEDVSDVVANGFRRYGPSSSAASSTAGSRWTPGSSVVDVSPRPSADTLRFAEMGETGVGEDKC